MSAGAYWKFEVPGKPRPKGSLSCLGAGRGRKHNMIEDVAGSKPWKLAIVREVRKAFGIEPIKIGNVVKGFEPAPAEGCFLVTVVFRFDQEGRALAAPTVANDHGDLDKLCRNLGDALEQAGLIRNDSMITGWSAIKRWCAEGEQPGITVEVISL